MKKEMLLEGFYIPETTLPFTIGLFNERRCESHWHHYWEILYQVEGETMIKVGSEEFHSREGEVTDAGGPVSKAAEEFLKMVRAID